MGNDVSSLPHDEAHLKMAHPNERWTPPRQLYHPASYHIQQQSKRNDGQAELDVTDNFEEIVSPQVKYENTNTCYLANEQARDTPDTFTTQSQSNQADIRNQVVTLRISPPAFPPGPAPTSELRALKRPIQGRQALDPDHHPVVLNLPTTNNLGQSQRAHDQGIEERPSPGTGDADTESYVPDESTSTSASGSNLSTSLSPTPSTEVSSRGVGLYISKLESIRYKEGERYLANLRPELWKKLYNSSVKSPNKIPEPVTWKWESGRTLHSLDGRYATYVIKGTNIELDSALLSYGQGRQLVIVAAKSGCEFNRGLSSFILRHPSFKSTKVDNQGFTRYPFLLWNPFDPGRKLWVERRTDPQCKQDNFSFRNLNDKHRRITPPESTFGQSNKSSMKRARCFSTSSESSDVPLARKRITTATEAISEPVKHRASRIDRSPLGGEQSKILISAESPPTVHMPTTVFNPVTHAHIAERPNFDPTFGLSELDKVQFVFRKAPDDPTPRKKPFRQCDNVNKFSCQASVHGLKPDICPGLVVHVKDLEPICIMRNDEADFQDLVRVIKGCCTGDGISEIDVLPMTE